MGRTEKETDQLKRSFFIVPEAATEVQEAFDWYEQQSVGLGHEFLRAATRQSAVGNYIEARPLRDPSGKSLAQDRTAEAVRACFGSARGF